MDQTKTAWEEIKSFLWYVFWCFLAVIGMHLYYFLEYISPSSRSFMFYVANATNESLPVTINLIVALGVFLIIAWWLNYADRIKDEEREARESLDKQLEAIKDETIAGWLKMQDREIELENEYAAKMSDLEQNRQSYLDEIEGLKARNVYLADKLRKARSAGNKKLQEQGQEGAAKRNEKKFEKMTDS